MLLEEKQDFTEELLGERRRRKLRTGGGEEDDGDGLADSTAGAQREASARESRG